MQAMLPQGKNTHPLWDRPPHLLFGQVEGCLGFRVEEEVNPKPLSHCEPNTTRHPNPNTPSEAPKPRVLWLAGGAYALADLQFMNSNSVGSVLPEPSALNVNGANPTRERGVRMHYRERITQYP